MAHCEEYFELISAAVDGALSPDQQSALEAHLNQCPECAALLEELTAIHAALGELPPVEIPAHLTQRIMAAVAAEQVIPFAPAGKKNNPRRWRQWAASAAVLAVVLMGTWGWKPWENRAKDMPAAPAQEVQQLPPSAGGSTSASQDALEPLPTPAVLEKATADEPSTPIPQSLPLETKAPQPKAAEYSTVSHSAEETPASGAQEDAPEEAPDASNSIAPHMAQTGIAPEEPSQAPESEAGASLQSPVLFSVAPTSQPLDSSTSQPEPEETPAPVARAFLTSTPPQPEGSPIPEEIGADEEAQPLTVEEALERVVEYIFEYSAPEDLTWETQEGEEEALICTVRWTDGGEEQTLVLHYFEPAEPLPEEYVFSCPQEDLHPYTYLVDKNSGQVNVMCMD